LEPGHGKENGPQINADKRRSAGCTKLRFGAVRGRSQGGALARAEGWANSGSGLLTVVAEFDGACFITLLHAADCCGTLYPPVR
jgi:hypothetical protein